MDVFYSVNSIGKTAFGEAVAGSYINCCELLLEHGAKVNLRETLPQAVKLGHSNIYCSVINC